MNFSQKNKTLSTILTTLTLQKKKIEHNIHTLKANILKKQQSIEVLDNYATEYKNKFYNTAYHTVGQFQNHQQFLDKLCKVLYSEKQELTQLETQQMALLTDFHTITQKIDGLDDLLITRRRAYQHECDHIEDANRSELATTRACREQMKENE